MILSKVSCSVLSLIFFLFKSHWRWCCVFSRMAQNCTSPALPLSAHALCSAALSLSGSIRYYVLSICELHLHCACLPCFLISLLTDLTRLDGFHSECLCVFIALMPIFSVQTHATSKCAHQQRRRHTSVQLAARIGYVFAVAFLCERRSVGFTVRCSLSVFASFATW